MAPPLNDLVGVRFGMLTAIEIWGTNKRSHALWLVRCDCGVEKTVVRTNLLNGSTNSCGCNASTSRVEKTTTHGLSKSKAYHAIRNAIRRCTNPDHASWDDYGGRGIYVCDRWLNNPELFVEDFGEPAKGLTLERVDDDGPYSPENCKWEPWSVQGRNKRNTYFVTYKGERRKLTDVCEELGKPLKAMYMRIEIYDWPIEKALSTPFRKRMKKPKKGILEDAFEISELQSQYKYLSLDQKAELKRMKHNVKARIKSQHPDWFLTAQPS